MYFFGCVKIMLSYHKYPYLIKCCVADSTCSNKAVLPQP